MSWLERRNLDAVMDTPNRLENWVAPKGAAESAAHDIGAVGPVNSDLRTHRTRGIENDASCGSGHCPPGRRVLSAHTC